jgi:5-methylthioribose kinase
MKETDVIEHVRERIPSIRVAERPVPLGGGYLNYVWRVRAEPAPVIVKCAQPFLASNPAVALDLFRTEIEARALEVFSPGAPLSHVSDSEIRSPRLLDFDADRSILIMEDAGDHPDLGRWLHGDNGDGVTAVPESIAETDATGEGERVGEIIGRFIALLHRATYLDMDMAALFRNEGVQRVRKVMLYDAVRAMYADAGLAGADEAGARAAGLGEELLEPGTCLTMGDLWPASVIVTPEGLRIIDWEFAHFGRSLQDVAHLAAHLWMHRHRAPTRISAVRCDAFGRAFLRSYFAGLGEERNTIWSVVERMGASVHFGAEILQRSIGTFKDGYLYAGLEINNELLREAATRAGDAIMNRNEF